jgi:hypothetical protein
VSYSIPIGPYHPALEEPYKLELLCDGEIVSDAVMHLGFNFRGIEYLAERRNYLQGITLVERVCGICSNVHSLSYCQAVEQLIGIEPPERALYIRVVLSELERLHSHFLWSGTAAKLIGFKTVFMACFTLREKVMDALSAISGNRVNYGMNCIGGVNRDISDPQSVLSILDGLENGVTRTILPIFLNNRAVESRCKGIGILTKEQAMAMGAVGPLARASGIAQDIRVAAPYCAYDRLEFNVPVETSGDVRARLIVHGELPHPAPGAPRAPGGACSHPDTNRRALQGAGGYRDQPCRSAPWRGALPNHRQWNRYPRARPRAHSYVHEYGHGSPGAPGAAVVRLATDSGIVRPLLLLHRPLRKSPSLRALLQR